MTKTELVLSKKLTTFIFAAIIFLLIASAFSFLFFDDYVVSFLHNTGIDWDNYRSVEIFKLLGKTHLLAWLILFYGIIKKPNHPAVLALLALLAVAAIVLPIKLAAHRERPGDLINEVYEQKNEEQPPWLLRSWSFPSGDTANCFAVAAVLLPFIRRRLTAAFFTASCFIGIFRFLTFAHYPSDVFGGVAAGILAGWIVLKIFSQKKLPEWIDSKQFFSAQVIAFILIPSVLALTEFRDFIDIVSTYGVFLAIIFIVFLLNKKQSQLRNQ